MSAAPRHAMRVSGSATAAAGHGAAIQAAITICREGHREARGSGQITTVTPCRRAVFAGRVEVTHLGESTLPFTDAVASGAA